MTRGHLISQQVAQPVKYNIPSASICLPANPRRGSRTCFVRANRSKRSMRARDRVAQDFGGHVRHVDAVPGIALRVVNVRRDCVRSGECD